MERSWAWEERFHFRNKTLHSQTQQSKLCLAWCSRDRGRWKKVKQQISNATQKAHAIFYVTKIPDPPQKGEEGKEGTIKKIQNQLDSQTEVYTLFNKPINSPRALKDGLIDENEKESLRDLNEKMKAILGKHYKRHQIVSAQVAFYGLSSALLPESDFYKNKQKFLDFFKAEELLLKSQFKQCF